MPTLNPKAVREEIVSPIHYIMPTHSPPKKNSPFSCGGSELPSSTLFLGPLTTIQNDALNCFSHFFTIHQLQTDGLTD